MGKRSVDQENLVYDDLVNKLRCVDEAYAIERNIDVMEKELKRLKIELSKNKMLMVKSLNASRRNYPEGIFNACVNVLRKAQNIIVSVSTVEMVKHRPLIRLEGKAVIKTIVNRRSTYQGQVKAGKRSNWNMMMNEVKNKDNMNKKVSRIAKKVVPHWDWKKPGEIAVLIESDEHSEKRVKPIAAVFDESGGLVDY